MTRPVALLLLFLAPSVTRVTSDIAGLVLARRLHR